MKNKRSQIIVNLKMKEKHTYGSFPPKKKTKNKKRTNTHTHTRRPSIVFLSLPHRPRGLGRPVSIFPRVIILTAQCPYYIMCSKRHGLSLDPFPVPSQSPIDLYVCLSRHVSLPVHFLFMRVYLTTNCLPLPASSSQHPSPPSLTYCL